MTAMSPPHLISENEKSGLPRTSVKNLFFAWGAGRECRLALRGLVESAHRAGARRSQLRTCRSTASLRTGPARFRTWGRCSYGAVIPWEERAPARPQYGV